MKRAAEGAPEGIEVAHVLRNVAALFAPADRRSLPAQRHAAQLGDMESAPCGAHAKGADQQKRVAHLDIGVMPRRPDEEPDPADQRRECPAPDKAEPMRSAGADDAPSRNLGSLRA